MFLLWPGNSVTEGTSASAVWTEAWGTLWSPPRTARRLGGWGGRRMRSAPGRLEPEATGGTSSGPGRATCHPVCDRKEGSHGGRAAARAPLLPAGFMSTPSPRARPTPRPWRRSSDQSPQPPPSRSLRCRKGGREQRGRGWGQGRGRGAAPHAAARAPWPRPHPAL